jgi:peptidoglycan/LPS O-acetylase OafA/YrhL
MKLASQSQLIHAIDGVINVRTLDIGRVLAASLIYYFHIGIFDQCPLSAYGQFAVEYFVMLSGISYILFSKSKPALWSEYFAYIKKRLTSLFPIFLLVNLLIYIGSFFYASSLGKSFSFVEFLASAAGISQYLGWKYMSNVMWFMPFIMQVYLLLPLIDWTARRINPVTLVLIAFGVSCLLAQMMPLFANSEYQLKLICKNWSPIFRLPEVCVGVILGRICLTRSGLGAGLLAVIVYGTLALAVDTVESTCTFGRFYMPWNGFVVPLFIFGVSALISPLLRAANSKLLRWLGISSLPFFLLHAAPIATISHHFQNKPSVWAAYFFICWIVAIAATWLAQQFNEKLAAAVGRSRTLP